MMCDTNYPQKGYGLGREDQGTPPRPEGTRRRGAPLHPPPASYMLCTETGLSTFMPPYVPRTACCHITKPLLPLWKGGGGSGGEM